MRAVLGRQGCVSEKFSDGFRSEHRASSSACASVPDGEAASISLFNLSAETESGDEGRGNC